jgi:hypothetical protein
MYRLLELQLIALLAPAAAEAADPFRTFLSGGIRGTSWKKGDSGASRLTRTSVGAGFGKTFGFGLTVSASVDLVDQRISVDEQSFNRREGRGGPAGAIILPGSAEVTTKLDLRRGVGFGLHAEMELGFGVPMLTAVGLAHAEYDWSPPSDTFSMSARRIEAFGAIGLGFRPIEQLRLAAAFRGGYRWLGVDVLGERDTTLAPSSIPIGATIHLEFVTSSDGGFLASFDAHLIDQTSVGGSVGWAF